MTISETRTGSMPGVAGNMFPVNTAGLLPVRPTKFAFVPALKSQFEYSS